MPRCASTPLNTLSLLFREARQREIRFYRMQPSVVLVAVATVTLEPAGSYAFLAGIAVRWMAEEKKSLFDGSLDFLFADQTFTHDAPLPVLQIHDSRG